MNEGGILPLDKEKFGALEPISFKLTRHLRMSMSKGPTENITLEEFISFLEEKCADSHCAGCDHDKFSIFTSPAEGLWKFESDAVNSKNYFLPTFAMYCDNCGLVRHHSAAVIRKWLMSEKAPSPTTPGDGNEH